MSIVVGMFAHYYHHQQHLALLLSSLFVTVKQNVYKMRDILDRKKPTKRERESLTKKRDIDEKENRASVLRVASDSKPLDYNQRTLGLSLVSTGLR